MKQTSIEAQQLSLNFKERHQKLILSALQDENLTAPEIAAKTGLNYVAVSRRMSELERKCKVRHLGKRQVWNRETQRMGSYSIYYLL